MSTGVAFTFLIVVLARIVDVSIDRPDRERRPHRTAQAGDSRSGIVLGTRVPIIVTSRADSVRSRVASSAVAMRVAYARRKVR